MQSARPSRGSDDLVKWRSRLVGDVKQYPDQYFPAKHRRTGPGGEGAAAPPPNFGQLRFFGQYEKIWAKPVFKDVSLFLLLF